MSGNKPILHGDDHLPGHADPINFNFPPGLLGAYANLDYAVTHPGGLLWRYQFASSTEVDGGNSLDTAGHPSGPWPLTVHEATTAVDPDGGAHASWDGTQRATHGAGQHTEFGSGDDGVIRFNYNQLHVRFGAGYPGAYYSAGSGSTPQFTWRTTLKSVSAFVRPRSGGAIVQGVLGCSGFSTTNGSDGWGITWNPTTHILSVFVVNGGGPPARSFAFSSPGALAPDAWYHVALTLDTATNLWSCYLNGVLIGSAVHDSSYDPARRGSLNIGMLHGLDGSFTDGSTYNAYLWGDVDEVDGYGVTLTQADVQAIYAARDAGYGTAVEHVTVGAGVPGAGNPGAVSSITVAGTPAPVGQSMTADGAGNTMWAYPTHGVYVGGT